MNSQRLSMGIDQLQMAPLVSDAFVYYSRKVFVMQHETFFIRDK